MKSRVAAGFQVATHMGVLYTGWQMARAQRPADFKPDVDGDFAPDLVNTTVRSESTLFKLHFGLGVFLQAWAHLLRSEVSS